MLSKLVAKYLNSRLSERDSLKLWKQLLLNQEYFNLFITEMYLHILFREKKKRP